ncbi:MerC family mercury resistance protein [Flavobacterium sp. RSP15]|uniref:MerC family mercury resistance protein n=1 Tax=Flavobacterium sp. RSP15 TaxID=2497485 RepID=UPI000F816AB6|nr:MerC family mercury resistance protein [Flavobacterium sp. RSP15]RTY88356.1 MerC domain-containing protein [Flavobacterium sp. RSP15]
MKKLSISSIDLLGISSAGLCLIHCLVLPLLTILPFGVSHNPYIDLLFALTGLWAVLRLIKTATFRIIVIFLLSISLILLSVLIDIFLDLHTNLLIIGGIGMILGHLLNYKNHKKKHL